MKIYLDFDGTVVEHDYPRIGLINYGCIQVISKLQKAGHDITLNTLRVELNDDSLKQALQWFKDTKRMLRYKDSPIEDFGHTNSKFNPSSIPWNWEMMKSIDCMCIDDITPGIPLKKALRVTGNMVDWDELDRQFKKHNIY